MIIGNRQFELGKKVYLMGILNVTPDSFSDGGKYHNMDEVLRTVEQFIEDGCDIVDVGGESTRPGHLQISIKEEINRVYQVIKEIKGHFDVPVSIDSYKAEVAKAACEAGADMINDIWGFKYDDQMACVAAQFQSAICLMHNRDNTQYSSFMEDVIDDLSQSIAIAHEHRISDDKIMLDPGVGFAKSYEQNLSVMAHLPEIKEMGYPILLGVSRKSVIGLATNRPVDDREAGTIATTVYGALNGCDFIRVHQVKENADALRMLAAINQFKGA